MSLRCHPARKHRSAFTLVELLIVMAILIVLAAVTLPSLKGLLSDQKVSQAARLVQVYAESARARAIANGRPVALILDRLRYDAGGGVGADALIANNTCVRLSTGDVFPPYQGDWSGAVGTLVDTTGNGFANAIQILFSEAASLVDTSVTPAVSSGMVNPGDVIEFGKRREQFAINSAPATTTVAGTTVVVLTFDNPPFVPGSASQMREPAWPIVGTAPLVNFRIYRAPSKSLSPGMSLPRGTCVDLHFSGMGQTGREFSSDSVHLTATPPLPDYPPSATSGNPNYGPTYIVFNPNGTVDSWYYQNRAGSVSTPILVRASPLSLIHLLVGSTDQVPQSPLLNPASALDSTDVARTNIMDTQSTWVSINPYSGNIASYALQGTSVPSPGLSDAVANRTAQARSLATNGVAQANN